MKSILNIYITICISWHGKAWWFLVKSADISIAQGACHVIYIFFESSLGKV